MGSLRRAANTKIAFLPAKRFANSTPNPLEAPVIKAHLPFTLSMVSSPFLSRQRLLSAPKSYSHGKSYHPQHGRAQIEEHAQGAQVRCCKEAPLKPVLQLTVLLCEQARPLKGESRRNR